MILTIRSITILNGNINININTNMNQNGNRNGKMNGDFTEQTPYLRKFRVNNYL